MEYYAVNIITPPEIAIQGAVSETLTRIVKKARGNLPLSKMACRRASAPAVWVETPASPCNSDEEGLPPKKRDSISSAEYLGKSREKVLCGIGKRGKEGGLREDVCQIRRR